MKAARLHAYHEALKRDEVDEPKAVGPLDVIVRIGAAGLCRTDLHIQEGQCAEQSQCVLPYTPAHIDRALEALHARPSRPHPGRGRCPAS